MTEWKSEQDMAMEYLQKAYQFQTTGKLLEAVANYKKSIEFHPTAEAHTYLGWAYSFQGLHEDAIQECKKAIKIDPEFGNPYNDIGAYLIEKGKLADAVPWLERAIQAKRYDSYCYPYYNLGRAYERLSDWFKALEYYQKSLEANQDYTLAAKAISRVKGVLN